MYTQCPQCLTIFAIEEDALQASLGIVDCGHCGQRFDALRTLSNTLPGERDTSIYESHAAERVPILTEAVPPASLPSAARHQSGEAPAAPTPEPEVDEPSASPVSADVAPPVSGPPEPEAGSDWFADFETELTTSLLSDATRAFPDNVAADYSWQVDELPTQAWFTAPDIPMAFWEVAADLDTPTWMADQESNRHEAAAAAERDALDSSGLPTPSESHPASDASMEIRGNIDPMYFEESGQPADPNSVQPPVDESTVDAPNRSGLDPADAGAAPTRPDGAPPANRLLAHDAAEADAAEAADITPIAGEVTGTGVVSDPAEPLAPVYVRPRSRRAVGVAWILGCLALVLVLAAQLAWIKRVDLFRDPATHPWTARACRVIACRLPPIRTVAKLELVSRDVRPDPHAAGALMITATVRNDAAFRQPWPVVVVELTDLDNNPVAMRRFRPAEYMPDAARRAAGIAAGATSAVAFEVADPGKRAVAFQFSFE
ncbi:MAG: DUF3426 domain-containing protein [Rhodanobacteraceae bacterium]